MKPIVDIFIPIAPGHARKLPMSLNTALIQTYQNIRILLYLDGINDTLEKILNQYWYTSNDKNKEIKKEGILIYEYCEKGVLIRRPYNSTGTAAIARQWLFEWPEKSGYVKMLDADDILLQNTIEIMMGYFENDTIDGVFCPLIMSTGNRFCHIIPGFPELGKAGSGCMLLRKTCMEEAVKDGFRWPNERGHDNAFLKFIQGRFNFVTTKENFLYLYLKD